ncbi:MAG: geranylgeranyl reductase family protein [candidate division Zixibacteria bacterium]|nr:geranylgeranyl reductase family protein [candidate division Zixibacteria bacterium]
MVRAKNCSTSLTRNAGTDPVTQDRYDIIVIGGGPAGSSAALRAAKGGARVLLLEKQRMPRPKLCGGWVSQRAIELLDVSLPEGLTTNRFARTSLVFRDVSQHYAPTEPLGIFVDRAQFDNFLYEQALAAGADGRVESVQRIQRDGTDYLVTCNHGSHRAQAVILCAGSNSSLITHLRSADRPDQSAIAVEQTIPVQYAGRWNLAPGDAWLGFGTVSHGFDWALHHGDRLLVGVGAKRSKVGNIREVFAQIWENWQLPKEPFAPEGHPIPLGGHKRVLARGRLLSAGDAAGMVDPFNGEGIAGAIRSGQLAADSLILDSTADAARVYTAACERELLPELRSARRVADLFHGLPDRLIRAFCSDPRLAEDYHDVLRQRMTYAAFLRRLIKRRLFGQTGVVKSNTSADHAS